MTPSPPTGQDGIAAQVLIRAVGLDDWSAVRHVHAASFNRFKAFDPELAAALGQLTASPEYIEDLQQEDLHAAWLDNVLVGTCGWLATDDSGDAARITSLHVDPLFSRLGIGHLLIEDAEARAAAAGFGTFTARTIESSVGFFISLGYEIASYGSSSLGGAVAPVIFLRKHSIRGIGEEPSSTDLAPDDPADDVDDTPKPGEAARQLPEARPAVTQSGRRGA